MVLGTIGIRNADRKESGHRAFARIGRFTGFVGTILALIAVVVFLVIDAVR